MPQDEALIKAAFAAGFRLGFTNGEDAAICYERGTRSQKPNTPQGARDEDVQWRIDTESKNYHLDIFDAMAWSEVP